MATEEAKIKILIDNSQSSKTLKEMRDNLKAINKELDETEVGSKAFKDLSNAAQQAQNKIQSVNAQMKQIGTNTNQAATSVSKAGGNITSSFSNIGSSALALAGSLGIAFGVQQVIAFGKSAINAAIEAEGASKRLESAVINVAGARMEDVAALEAQAAAIEQNIGYDGEEVKALQTQYLQLGLNTEQTANLTQATIDLAAATGVSLSEAQAKVAGGLNGQTKGLKALGIQFKDTGSQAGNFDAILGQINEKYAGEGAKAAETYGFQVQRLQKRFEDFQEGIGFNILNGINALADAMDALFIGDFNTFFDKIKEFNENLNPLDAGIFGILEGIGKIRDAFSLLFDGDFEGFFEKIVTGFIDITTSMNPVLGAYKALAERFGLVDEKIVETESRISRLGKMFNEDFKIAVNAGGEALENYRQAAIRAGISTKDFEKVLNNFADSDAAKNAPKTVAELREAVADLKKQQDATIPGSAEYLRLQKEIDKINKLLSPSTEKVKTEYQKLNDEITKLTNSLQNSILKNGPIDQKQIDRVIEIRGQLNQAATALEKLLNPGGPVLDELLPNAKDAFDGFKTIAEDSAKDLADKLSKLREINKKETEDLAKDNERLTRGLIVGTQESLDARLKANTDSAALARENAEEEYNAAVELAKKNGSDIVSITEEYQKILTDITKDESNNRKEIMGEELKTQDQKYNETLAKVTQYTQQIGGAILDIVSFANEQIDSTLRQSLDKFAADAEAATAIVDAQREQGLLTEREYQNQINFIQEEQRNKERDAKKKAFKQKKTADIISAVINTAVAVTSQLSAGPIIGFVLAGLAAALGAVQIATIAGQPEPKFARGGLVEGPGSSVSDSIPAKLSAGEFIMNARSTQQFLPILQTLNNAGNNPQANGLSGPQTSQSSQAQRVYVVESDITDTQNKLKRIRARTTY